MSLPSKGRRKIIVDGTQYNWRVRHKPTYMQGCQEGKMSAAIELDGCNGSVLAVEFPWHRPDSFLSSRGDNAVTPKTIETCIENAIAQGWNPSAKGATFHYRYSDRA